MHNIINSLFLVDFEQNVDELLLGLASMGFELEDCQSALEAGNNTLESAVEWYATYLVRTSRVQYTYVGLVRCRIVLTITQVKCGRCRW